MPFGNTAGREAVDQNKSGITSQGARELTTSVCFVRHTLSFGARVWLLQSDSEMTRNIAVEDRVLLEQECLWTGSRLSTKREIVSPSL